MRATNPGFVPDSPFQRRLTPEWLEFFETFPKAELHCHLLGTIRKETFEDLVRESNAPVSPVADERTAEARDVSSTVVSDDGASTVSRSS